MTDGELAELLRSVIARPDDHDALRVYADVLIERGDLRGEMIAVQLQRRELDSPELAARERELSTALDAALIAELAQPRLEISWRDGFIDTIDIAPAGTQLKDSLRRLATLTVGRRLRRIVIRCAKPGWGALQQHLVAAPQLKALRELAITEHMRPGDEIEPSSIGKLAVFARGCPKLEVLVVDSRELSLVDLELPAIRKLAFGRIAPYALWPLAGLPMPRLEELAIHFAVESGGDNYLARILPIRLPSLRRLELGAVTEYMHRIVSATLDSPLLPHLRVLAFRGLLESKTVRALVKSGGALRKLDRVEVQVEDRGDIRRLEAAIGRALVVVR